MFPTVVPVEDEADLHEGTPFRTLGFADEVHAGFVRGAVALAGVAGNAGTDNVFPRGGPAAVARDDVVEVQVFALENFAAVLAGIIVALEDVVAREFHFLLRHPIIHEEKDDLRHADAEGNGVDGLFVGRVGGDIAPFLKIKSAEGAIGVFHHHLRVALKEKRERPTSSADIDRLPEPVQHQNVLVQRGFHCVTMVGTLPNGLAVVNGGLKNLESFLRQKWLVGLAAQRSL